jgi:hypothetical protein
MVGAHKQETTDAITCARGSLIAHDYIFPPPALRSFPSCSLSPTTTTTPSTPSTSNTVL